jgi:segregation and condensation protein A
MSADEAACRITLDEFEGPLDLLLFLIRRDELDILEISVSRVADQYLEYIRAMHELELDVASEYLVMAATLMRIKSRSLLPSSSGFEGDEEDSQTQLLRQLVLYRAFREVSAELRESEAEWRDVFTSPGERDRWSDDNSGLVPGQTTLLDLLSALENLSGEAEGPDSYVYQRPSLTLSECIESLRVTLSESGSRQFMELLGPVPTRSRVIAFFIAVLELVRRGWLDFRQPFPFAEIEIERTERWYS